MADDFVMEVRTEIMVSPTASSDGQRAIAHFLRPTVTSTNGPAAVPYLSANRAAKFRDLPLKVKFIGWSRREKTWKTWVDQMSGLHRSTWERAGIHDAIMNSTTVIHRHDDMIFEFLEKWSPATNTFAFPWGEATVTLEDTAVLGGYAVLGECLTSPPEDEETREVTNDLLRERSKFFSTKARNASQGSWMTKFMGSESKIEHEAFLAYWLSRYVFPCDRHIIGKRNLLSIAARLGRGAKIALAPAVLSAIYKSLSLLKAAVIATRKSFAKEPNHNDAVEITVSGQLPLVQVWIWERFPSLRPNPNNIKPNEPRLARWSSLRKLGLIDLSLIINSAGEEFQWRPYTCGKLYKDSGYFAILHSDSDDEDLQTLVRSLRTSELPGLEPDCIEQYLPHRVGMQLGMDQDIPAYVARVNVNSQLAWKDYNRPIRDTEIYVPPRDSDPKCTARYLKWWKKLGEGWVAEIGCKAPKVEERNMFLEIKLEDDESPPPPSFSREDDDLPPPPGFSPKRQLSLMDEEIVQEQRRPLSPTRGLGVGDEIGSEHKVDEVGDEIESERNADEDKEEETGKENLKLLLCEGDEIEIDRELEAVEERVNKLQKLCAWLKSGNGKWDLPI